MTPELHAYLRLRDRFKGALRREFERELIKQGLATKDDFK